MRFMFRRVIAKLAQGRNRYETERPSIHNVLGVYFEAGHNPYRMTRVSLSRIESEVFGYFWGAMARETVREEVSRALAYVRAQYESWKRWRARRRLALLLRRGIRLER